MTSFASVAMLEKLALLRMASCKAPVVSKASWRRTSMMPSAVPATGLRMAGLEILVSLAPRGVRFPVFGALLGVIPGEPRLRRRGSVGIRLVMGCPYKSLLIDEKLR